MIGRINTAYLGRQHPRRNHSVPPPSRALAFPVKSAGSTLSFLRWMIMAGSGLVTVPPLDESIALYKRRGNRAIRLLENLGMEYSRSSRALKMLN